MTIVDAKKPPLLILAVATETKIYLIVVKWQLCGLCERLFHFCCTDRMSCFCLQQQRLRVPDVPQKGQPHNRDATVGMEPAAWRRVQLEYVQLSLDAVHDVH